MNQKKRVLQIKSKTFKFQATTNIRVRIGGRMRCWQKGEGVDLDEETIRQYLHPNDYEKISQVAGWRPGKNKNPESDSQNTEGK